MALQSSVWMATTCHRSPGSRLPSHTRWTRMHSQPAADSSACGSLEREHGAQRAVASRLHYLEAYVCSAATSEERTVSELPILLHQEMSNCCRLELDSSACNHACSEAHATPLIWCGGTLAIALKPASEKRMQQANLATCRLKLRSSAAAARLRVMSVSDSHQERSRCFKSLLSEADADGWTQRRAR